MVSRISRTTVTTGLALLLLGLTACSSGRASRTLPPPTPSIAATPARTAVATASPTPLPTPSPSPMPTLAAIPSPPPAPAVLPAPPPLPAAPTAAAPTAAVPPPTNLVSVPLPSVATTAVTYPAGWNLIAGSQGTVITGNDGPLYTLHAGESAYEVVPNGTPLQAGAGYWAYFPQPATESLPIVGLAPATIALVQNGAVMAGDPWNTPISITSSDQVLYTYDPRTGYRQTTIVLPGQGVWAYSFTAGTLTLSPTSP